MYSAQLYTPSAGPRPGSGTSVIIVNYNTGARLYQCIRSLMETLDELQEVLLVDNASTDGSTEDVEKAFPGLRIIRNPVNAGFGGANNLGVASATGDYLAFLNPDTVVEEGWLQPLIDALEANPQAGLATSRILMLDDHGRINTCGNDVHFTGITLCRGMGEVCTALPGSAVVGAVSGACFLIRRDLFDMLDGFDESFFMYMEDTDLSVRARLAGYLSLYVPGSTIYHDYTLRFGLQKTFYQERNRYLMLLKGLRWPTLIALLPALLIAEALAWGFALLRERTRLTNKLNAYAWIVKNWKSVMVRRGQVQKLRRARDRELIEVWGYRMAYEQVMGSMAARLAHALLDPIFFIFHKLAMVVTWW